MGRWPGRPEGLELLHDLGQMPVTFNGVCVDCFVDLAEVRPDPRRAPSAAHARLRIHDDVGADQSTHCGGREGEDGSGGKAARDRDQLRALQLVFVKLRQPKHRLLEQRRLRVRLAVPLRIKGSVVEPEVGAHVDHPRSCVEPSLHPRRANVVRQAAEDHVDGGGRRLGQELPRQVGYRKDLGEGFTGVRARGELCQLDARMPRQQVHRSHPRIAVCPGDRRLQLPRHERMSIQLDA